MNVSSVSVFKKPEKNVEKEKSEGYKAPIEKLNDALFASLERLSSLDIKDENFDQELARSEAITKTAHTIIEEGQLALSYQKHLSEYGNGQVAAMPLMGLTDSMLIEQNYNLRERVKKAEDWH